MIWQVTLVIVDMKVALNLEAERNPKPLSR